MQDFLKINDNDNVVVALNTIPAGEKITVSVGDGSKTVTAREEIPAGHKMAICDIPEGGEVITSDGPFAEAKEHLGGFWVIKAEDLDDALRWAAKGSAACKGPVEVRPFQDDAPED